MQGEILTGQRFTRLVVRGDAGPYVHKGKSYRRVHCQCDCGADVVCRPTDLRSGNTQSCGCLSRDMTVERSTVHGDAKRQGRSPEYRTWHGMNERCRYPKHKDWQYYGGRGIAVCDEWRNSFPAFLAHVGRKPSPQHSIDRIENDRGYEPGNVRWATAKEQTANRGKRSLENALLQER